MIDERPWKPDLWREPDLCHIRVRFTHPNVELDYQDERHVADRFAAAVQRLGAAVTVDNDLRHGLRPLPCRRLWI
jgi:hypothetical protein